MSQYLRLRGKEADLKKQKTKLVTAIKAEARAIEGLLPLLSTSSVDDIDADSILHHAQDLKARKDELSQINADLREIRKELGED